MKTFKEYIVEKTETYDIPREYFEEKLIKIFDNLKQYSNLKYIRLVGANLLNPSNKEDKYGVRISGEWTGLDDWKYPKDKYEKDRTKYREYLKKAIEKGLGEDAKHFNMFDVSFGNSVSIPKSSTWIA